MLNKRYEFRWPVLDEGLEVVQDYFTKEPPPGISPIPDAKVIRLEPAQTSDDAVAEVIEIDGEEVGMATAIVEMSVESFVRCLVQYGTDPYVILQEVKEVCGEEVAAATMKFMQEATDLTKAVLMIGNHEMTAEQWPTTPEL